jgi:hypothetical protein
LKNTLRAFVTLVCLVPQITQASIVTYGFDGELYSLFEYDPSVGPTPTHLSSSSIFGHTIAIGDTVHGYFSYDTEAVETNFRELNPSLNTAIYNSNAVTSLYYEIGATYTFQSTGVGNVQIWDNRNGLDLFHLQDRAWEGDFYAATALLLLDTLGNSINGFDLDELPNLGQVSSSASQLNPQWIRKSDQYQLQARLSIDSVTLTPVPLPAAAWLFISAIAGLAGAKRLSRSKGSA